MVGVGTEFGIYWMAHHREVQWTKVWCLVTAVHRSNAEVTGLKIWYLQNCESGKTYKEQIFFF